VLSIAKSSLNISLWKYVSFLILHIFLTKVNGVIEMKVCYFLYRIYLTS